MGVDTTLTGVPGFDKLELVKTGSYNMTRLASVDHTFTPIYHGLGFRPIAIVSFNTPVAPFTDAATYSIPAPHSFFFLTGANSGKLRFSWYYTIDSQYLYLDIDVCDLSIYYTQDFDTKWKYYLYRPRGAEIT